MKNRTLVTLILATIMILVVMCASVLVTFAGSVNATKYTTQAVWGQNFPSADSMKIIDLTGDGQRDLFLQNKDTVRITDSTGAVLFEANFGTPLATTMGDLNGDSVEDVLVFEPRLAQAFSQGPPLWRTELRDFNQPSRAAVVRFAEGTQAVLGDLNGQLLALSNQGNALWQANVSSGDYIRGLDDALVEGKIHLAAANRNGTVMVFNHQGQPLWAYSLTNTLRRLRAYDLNGDGTGEVLLGGDGGTLVMLNAANGQVLASVSLGQTITEIREAEINGEPSSREFIVGGKSGGVWAFDVTGNKIWSASVGARVSGIVSLDLDGDGAGEVIIGDESGGVYLFTGKDGTRHKLLTQNSGITRLDTGKLSASNQLVVADGSQVQLFGLEHSTFAPMRFTPLLVGLVISFIIALAAWFLATLPPKPALRLAIEDQTPESLQAQRRMLKENIADVERLRSSGEMTPDA